MRELRICSRQRLVTFLAGCCLLAFAANLRLFYGDHYYNEPHHERPPPPPQPHGAHTPPSPPPEPKESHPRPGSPPPASHYESNLDLSNACAGYPKHSDVVIVVKTGATEAFRKFPSQLMTFLQCAKNDVLLFSDMAQDIAGYHAYDSLKDVSAEARFNNTEFELYKAQYQYRLEGEDIMRLSDRSQDAWALDKYKNLHIAQRTWELRPNKSWYFYIDTDTYVVWSSFFHMLKQYDASKEWYLGSWVSGDGDPSFAHGGSGYALSKAAMLKLVGNDAKELADKFDMEARVGCCGDKELGKTLGQKNINITNVFPMVNGEKPRRYPFGPKYWCQPLVTMHHMEGEELNDMWQFELKRAKAKEPLLLQELFTSYIEPRLQGNSWREDWDNLANDITIEKVKDKKAPTSDAWKSFDDCQTACQDEPSCYSYLHFDQTCRLGKGFPLGNRKWTDTRIRSGWDLNKIAKWKRENVCKGAEYKAFIQFPPAGFEDV